VRELAKGFAVKGPDRDLGRGLARRLAERVAVEDQGRVAVRVGAALIDGTQIRRKVLALLCFLLTKPDVSATRNQVLDALWPDVEPDVAANSLNQTVYFLRRVFEPSYVEDLSPGYVHHDSEVLWLDPELVTSRSRLCRNLVRGQQSSASVQALSDAYLGRFALDFAYEEWAVAYRDSLHAAYLEVIEHGIQEEVNAGHFGAAIGLARRAVEVDEEADQLELTLLRLYRVTGAHAAAAEQYGHYSAVLRQEDGVGPPPLASL
jgi:DNA-binding SARP family transcriptional activator